MAGGCCGRSGDAPFCSGMLRSVPFGSGMFQDAPGSFPPRYPRSPLAPAAGSGRAPGPVTAHVTARMAAVAGGWRARRRRRRRRGRGEEEEEDDEDEGEGGPGTEAVLRRLREAR